MNTALLLAASAMVVVTCLVHSAVGEYRLIGPLLKQRVGVLQSDMARQVLRFAWHLMSALGVIAAYALFSAATNPAKADPRLLWLIGLILAASGLIDAIYTRGKHIGWPLLTAAGVTTLAAIY